MTCLRPRQSIVKCTLDGSHAGIAYRTNVLLVLRDEFNAQSEWSDEDTLYLRIDYDHNSPT